MRLEQVGQVRERVPERRQFPVEDTDHARFGRVEDLGETGDKVAAIVEVRKKKKSNLGAY